MSDKNSNGLENEYEVLMSEIKKELPNIIFPSMGMFDEVGCVDINGKDFIVGNEEV